MRLRNHDTLFRATYVYIIVSEDYGSNLFLKTKRLTLRCLEFKQTHCDKDGYTNTMKFQGY